MKKLIKLFSLFCLLSYQSKILAMIQNEILKENRTHHNQTTAEAINNEPFNENNEAKTEAANLSNLNNQTLQENNRNNEPINQDNNALEAAANIRNENNNEPTNEDNNVNNAEQLQEERNEIAMLQIDPQNQIEEIRIGRRLGMRLLLGFSMIAVICYAAVFFIQNLNIKTPQTKCHWNVDAGNVYLSTDQSYEQKNIDDVAKSFVTNKKSCLYIFNQTFFDTCNRIFYNNNNTLSNTEQAFIIAKECIAINHPYQFCPANILRSLNSKISDYTAQNLLIKIGQENKEECITTTPPPTTTTTKID